MANSIVIDVSKEAAGAPSDVSRRMAALRGARLNVQIGRGVANLFAAHLWKLDAQRANKLGGERTHFYGDAAKATSSSGDDAGATVTVAQQGIRQRLEGGVIRPTGGRKYLTIPARAQAYGKRASEFKNLRVVLRWRDGKVRAVALEEAPSQDVSFGRKRKDGSRKVTPGAERGGLVMFWLVPGVVQKADRTVLPSDAEIEASVRKTVDMAWNRKEGGPTP